MVEHQDELTLLNGDVLTPRLNGDATAAAQGDVTPRLDDLEAAMMEDSTHTLKGTLVNGTSSNAMSANT